MPDLLLELPSSLENTLTHLQDAVSGCAELARLGVMFERSGMFACGAIELAQFPVRRPGAFLSQVTRVRLELSLELRTPCPVLLRDFSSGQDLLSPATFALPLVLSKRVRSSFRSCCYPL